MKSRIIAAIFFLIIALFVKGQTVSNLRFEQSGKIIDVYYDLYGESDELFQISLYYSQDGGKTWGAKLNYVTGDVSQNIMPGTDKKITWDVLKEREKLIGEVKFKVEALPMSGCRSFTITHTAGNIAPVKKTVTYGVAETNLTGSKKCWITQNLGADRQANSAIDATEASAGWYWQFNRKQGYKHDFAMRTPNTKWEYTISGNSDWLPANDPCTLLLGNGWRLPSKTEWETADANGSWDNFNKAFASELKLHAAGYLAKNLGSVGYRGNLGYYWSSSQYSSDYGQYLYFGPSLSSIYRYYNKAYGFTIRCLRD